MSVAGVRASGGARVCARVEEDMMTGVRRVFIGTGTTQCYYTGAPGGSHLKDTCMISISSFMQHIEGCSTFPCMPGL